MEDSKKAKATIIEDEDQGAEFDFICPVSGEYEVVIDIDENLRGNDEYIRETSSRVNMKYSEGILHFHADLSPDQGINIKVTDADQTYEILVPWSSAYSSSERCEIGATENIHVEYEGLDDEEEDETS